MKISWGRFLRRMAAVCMIGASPAWSAAVSYAAFLAADSATNAPYDDGWQAGDNGGFGFGAWDFTGTYNTPVGQTMDIFSDPNDLGRAWTLFNADAPPGPGAGTDIAQAGRLIPGGLAPGNTITVVVDNPIERRFFRGYTVRFNSGGGNTVYAGVPQSRMAVGTFEYFTNGKWFATGTGGNPNLFDLDTRHGMRIDLTLTGIDTFHLEMTPLNDPSIKFTKNGTLAGPAGAPINWVEFELYNTDSDWYPTHTITGGETDFYISYMQVTGEIPEPSSVLLAMAGVGGLGILTRRKRE
jgi:PEP-CTERM motif-containing protein